MQKTRIICTIGPATESYEMLQKMYEAGMTIARLNMSHGDHDFHAKVIQHIKTLNKKVKFPIPILLDTQGPAIRTGDLSNELDLRQGAIVSVTTRGPMDDVAGIVPVAAGTVSSPPTFEPVAVKRCAFAVEEFVSCHATTNRPSASAATAESN